MIGKKLIITEEERKEIKTLYGLITEQDATQKNPELTLDLAGTFGSGKYLIPGKADKIDDLINQIREFKKQNAGSVIEISVNSGESQVPNYDREKYPSTGNDKVDFTNEKKLYSVFGQIVPAFGYISPNSMRSHRKQVQFGRINHLQTLLSNLKLKSENSVWR